MKNLCRKVSKSRMCRRESKFWMIRVEESWSVECVWKKVEVYDKWMLISNKENFRINKSKFRGRGLKMNFCLNFFVLHILTKFFCECSGVGGLKFKNQEFILVNLIIFLYLLSWHNCKRIFKLGTFNYIKPWLLII